VRSPNSDVWVATSSKSWLPCGGDHHLLAGLVKVPAGLSDVYPTCCLSAVGYLESMSNQSITHDFHEVVACFQASVGGGCCFSI
jgi:hypothetical protein